MAQSICRHVVAVPHIARGRDCQHLTVGHVTEQGQRSFQLETNPSLPVFARTSGTSFRGSQDDRSTTMRHRSQLLETLKVRFLTSLSVNVVCAEDARFLNTPRVPSLAAYNLHQRQKLQALPVNSLRFNAFRVCSFTV
jgi:hypothetical protein